MLFLSAWFPNRVSPFNGDFIERQALAVSQFCPTSVVHVTSDNQINARFFEVKVTEKGALFEVIIYFKRNNCRLPLLASLINWLFYGLGYMKGYRMIRIRYGKPGIIHANIISPVVIAAATISLFTRIPFIVSEHWTLFLSDKAEPGYIIRKALKKASAIVPVTENLRKALIKHGITGKYYVVPNVADTNLFAPDGKHITGDKKQLIHVSSMKEEHKNICGIIRAIKQLREIREDFQLTFIGDYKAHQMELASESGLLDKFISFRGEMSHADVASLMKQSQIFVLFSNVENLPCVLLEAMSCGLPVISTDTGGISEWITDTKGLLVKPGNEDDLLKALIYMLDHFRDYNSEDLHQFAIAHFSQEVIAQKLTGIYKKAMDAGHYV